MARQPVVSLLCRLHYHTRIHRTWKDSHSVNTNKLVYLCIIYINWFGLFVCLFVPTQTGCLLKLDWCESSVRDSDIDSV
jgi:hypothetical protein